MNSQKYYTLIVVLLFLGLSSCTSAILEDEDAGPIATTIKYNDAIQRGDTTMEFFCRNNTLRLIELQHHCCLTLVVMIIKLGAAACWLQNFKNPYKCEF